MGGALGVRAPSCISYFGKEEVSNKDATHFTLGLRPRIISSFLLQKYLRPCLFIEDFRINKQLFTSCSPNGSKSTPISLFPLALFVYSLSSVCFAVKKEVNEIIDWLDCWFS